MDHNGGVVVPDERFDMFDSGNAEIVTFRDLDIADQIDRVVSHFIIFN